MAETLLVLYDDAVARSWEPFALTRPVGELRYGTTTLRERAERAFGLRCIGHLAATHLQEYHEPWAPRVLALEDIPADRDVLFWSSRAVAETPPALPAGGRAEAELLALDDGVAGWYAPASAERPGADFILDAATAPGKLNISEGAGELLRRPWDLVLGNARRIARDVRDLLEVDRNAGGRESLPDGVHTLGDGTLIMQEDVEIEPGVVLDLREGPIWLERGVRVRAFTRLAGPSHVAADSTILGGVLDAVSVGPVCKIHGEVEESIFLTHSNKAHDGFLGHSYVGAWVNLGAMTTNSDLKNNYGPVRVWTPQGPEDTGSAKVGSFLGDHVKTAIGTLLNTGTMVGAGANLFGEALPGKHVRPFAWGNGPDAGTYRMDKFLETAETVMGRRDVTLSNEQRSMLRRAWERAEGGHDGSAVAEAVKG